MTDPTCFYDTSTFAKTKQLIDVELAKSREDFIEHFRNTYSDPYPPAWMLAEILPLGVLTRIYDNIRSNQIRKKIAQEFSLGKVKLSVYSLFPSIRFMNDSYISG